MVSKETKRRATILLLGALLGILMYSVELPVSAEARMVLGITVMAMVYWISEVIPLHITALLVSFLLITVVGYAPKDVFAPYFDPVIVLLLGGFVLSVAMHKHRLDELIAFRLIHKFGSNPTMILLGIMSVTAFLSLWMSNTACTAVMLPIGLIILTQNKLRPLSSNYGKAMVLGIANAATIGGIGTLVGTTPNPIAAKYLTDLGMRFDFVEWLYHGLPFVIIFIPVAAFVLSRMYKSEKKSLTVKAQVKKMSREMKSVLLIFALTVFLWLTTRITSLDTSTVSLIPIILLYLTRLLDKDDFMKAHWDILILIGGGLSLGMAFHACGLDVYMASVMQQMIMGQSLFIASLIVIFFAVVLTSFISNTAAAAILIPLMIPLAQMTGMDVRTLTVIAAIGVSLDFIVPIGTPPMAIAYSSGYTRVKDMMKAGLVLAVLGALLLAVLAGSYWQLL